MDESTDAGRRNMRDVKLTFTEHSYGVLEQLAAATGVTQGELVANSLSWYWWLAREKRNRETRILAQRCNWNWRSVLTYPLIRMLFVIGGFHMAELEMPDLKHIGPLPEPSSDPETKRRAIEGY